MDGKTVLFQINYKLTESFTYLKNQKILTLPTGVQTFTEHKHVWYQSRVLFNEISNGNIYFK